MLRFLLPCSFITVVNIVCAQDNPNAISCFDMELDSTVKYTNPSDSSISIMGYYLGDVCTYLRFDKNHNLITYSQNTECLNLSVSLQGNNFVKNLRIQSFLDTNGYSINWEGNQCVSSYQIGLENGDILVLNSFGQIKKLIEMKGGQIDGLYMEFYENGSVNTIFHYERGIRTGDCYEFHPNGQLATYKQYLDGVLIGNIERFDENGMPIMN